MGSRPRNQKVTDERVAKILDALTGGCTRRAAAGYAGIHPATLYRMLDADATLRELVEKAEAAAEARATAVIADAFGKNWQAAAWWLERRKHEDYAQRQRVDMRVDLHKVAEQLADADGLDPDALIAEAERIVSGA